MDHKEILTIDNQLHDHIKTSCEEICKSQENLIFDNTLIIDDLVKYTALEDQSW